MTPGQVTIWLANPSTRSDTSRPCTVLHVECPKPPRTKLSPVPERDSDVEKSIIMMTQLLDSRYTKSQS